MGSGGLIENVKGSLARGTKRAGNGTRTRDPQLGKLILYQLSYARLSNDTKEIPWRAVEVKKMLAADLKPGRRGHPGVSTSCPIPLHDS